MAFGHSILPCMTIKVRKMHTMHYPIIVSAIEMAFLVADYSGKSIGLDPEGFFQRLIDIANQFLGIFKTD